MLRRWMLTNLQPAKLTVMDIEAGAIQKCKQQHASQVAAGTVRQPRGGDRGASPPRRACTLRPPCVHTATSRRRLSTHHTARAAGELHSRRLQAGPARAARRLAGPDLCEPHSPAISPLIPSPAISPLLGSTSRRGSHVPCHRAMPIARAPRTRASDMAVRLWTRYNKPLTRPE